MWCLCFRACCSCMAGCLLIYGLPAAALAPVSPHNLMPTWSTAGVRPSHASRVVPAGAWAKILRSSKADYAALAIPCNREIPADFKYQPPMVDARNPDAITFVVESDPPQLSLGLNIPRKLELKLMAIDYWQQAAWAQNQLHDPAARKAYIAGALKKVQAVVHQVQKQQAFAAGTGSAREWLGGAGDDEAWPAAVVLPSSKQPSSPPRRIDIQGPLQGALAPAALQLQHVPQQPSATGDSSARGASRAVQPSGNSSSHSAAAKPPSRGARHILLQERMPEQGCPGAASADAAERSAVRLQAGTEPDAAQGALGSRSAEPPQGAHGQHLQQSGQAFLQSGAAAPRPDPLQHQRQQAMEPLHAGTTAVAEAAEQAAEAASGPAKQPTQAADAFWQQPSQAGAGLVPDAAIQAAVEAKVQAAMSQQKCALRRELQQATLAGQELHSQVAHQQEVTQRLQQNVGCQVSRKDGGSVIEFSCG